MSYALLCYDGIDIFGLKFVILLCYSYYVAYLHFPPSLYVGRLNLILVFTFILIQIFVSIPRPPFSFFKIYASSKIWNFCFITSKIILWLLPLHSRWLKSHPSLFSSLIYFELYHFYFVEEQNIYGLCFLSSHPCFSLRSIIRYDQHLLPVLLHKIFQSFPGWLSSTYFLKKLLHTKFPYFFHI